MAFWNEVSENDKKGIFTSDDNIVSYPTGITALDFANGFWNETVDEDGNKILVPIIGIQGGSMISIISETGGGKALPDYTMIPTPTGYRRFDSLKYGDKVFNREGKPVSVVGIYPQGKKEIYEVYFSPMNDSKNVFREAKCCIDHLWSVFDEKDNLQTLSLAEMIAPEYNLATIDSDTNLVDLTRPYCIPVNQPVQFEYRKTPVNPWIIGVLLSLGKKIKPQGPLTMVTKDKLLVEKMALLLDAIAEKDPHDDEYQFISNKTKKYIKLNELLRDVPEITTLSYGHSLQIPDLYHYNAINIRLGVLSGLLDTCGNISRFKHKITLSIENVSLMSSIFDLCQSLGFLTIISIKRDGCYIIEIRCDNKYAPHLFTLGKKHAIACKFAKSKFFNKRYVEQIRISFIRKTGGTTSMRCIVVDDPEHLFLTEDYLVTHNSTLSIQMGWNIVKNFDDGMLAIIDCEKTNNRQRIANLTGTDYDEPRIVLTKTHTTIEDVLEMFNKMCDVKESGGKKFMYEVKYGARSSWHYVPTVIIIDSLPAFNSKDYNVEDLGSNTDQMRASKDVSRFYNNVLDRAWKYNFIFIVINHIRPATIMNPYAQPPRGLMMINSQSETLPRGSVAQYYSNTYFRIKTNKSSKYDPDAFGFSGYKCEISLAKSKTNAVGTSFPVTFNTSSGFDTEYSMYEFASSLGLIQGRNPYLYLKGFEDRKFSKKEFKGLMIHDTSFREGVIRVLKPYYYALLGEKKNLNEEEGTTYGDITFDEMSEPVNTENE